MECEKNFRDYITEIENLVKNNRFQHNVMGRSIRKTDFSEDEVYPNKCYFEQCYNANMTAEEAVESLCGNAQDLLRYINRIPNDIILEEVNSRYLTCQVLSDADTDDLEDELRDRWDSNLVNLYDVSDDDLVDELIRRKKYAYVDKNGAKSLICEALGLNNSFAYSVEEIIEEIKKIF